MRFETKNVNTTFTPRRWVGLRAANNPDTCCTERTSLLLFLPKYPLNHPENYLFSLSNKMFSGSKYPKKHFTFVFNILKVFNFEKRSTGDHALPGIANEEHVVLCLVFCVYCPGWCKPRNSLPSPCSNKAVRIRTLCPPPGPFIRHASNVACGARKVTRTQCYGFLYQLMFDLEHLID